MDIGHGPHILHPQARQHEHEHHHHHHGQTGTSSPAGSIDSFKTDGETRHDAMPTGEHAMSMVFHNGVNEIILFRSWHSRSTFALVVSCLIIFAVAVMYEGLKFYRQWLNDKCKRRLEGGSDNRQRYQSQQHPSQNSQPTTQTFVFRPTAPPPPPPVAPPSRPPQSKSPTSTTRVNIPSVVPNVAMPSQILPSDDSRTNRRKFPCFKIWFSAIHIFQTFLHMLQVFISFLLMLVFMTYNVWLCAAVVLGAGVGYFIFFAYNETILEHCN